VVAQLEVRVPRTHVAEREYSARVVLGEFLGIDHVVTYTEGEGVVLRLRGDDERQVAVADGLFAHREEDWLTPRTLPREPIVYREVGLDVPDAQLVEPRLPILYGPEESRPLFEGESRSGSSALHLDVFGAAFFALTRYEEAVDDEARDEHGRFRARSSLAYRAGFLERAVVDEYVELLRAVIERVWPGLPAARPKGELWLTHDVDLPLVAAGRPWWQVARSLGADLVNRRSPRLAWRRIAGWARARRGDLDGDPANTFDFLMDVAEREGLRASFNFLAGGTAEVDGSYRLTEPWIRRLLQRIAARGHEVGFHGSYDAYEDPHLVAAEFQHLRATAETLGIAQPVWGGRQHFLRWSNPWTWRAWSDAGLQYDSSLSYAELPGFRAGTSRAYPVFDLERRCVLPLFERPLTFMDASATRYLHLNRDETLGLACRLAQRCKAAGGTFVLLWHNDAVMTESSRELYRDLVGEVV
jgi:uncharacterized protein DUF7033